MSEHTENNMDLTPAAAGVTDEDLESQSTRYMIGISDGLRYGIDAEKVETIQEALKKRQEDVMLSFEMYLSDQYEIAKNMIFIYALSFFLSFLSQSAPRLNAVFWHSHFR